MASILHFYGFHKSQVSPMGMLRVRHFEFLCRSQGLEPSVEKFRGFYQLIRNMGFYLFGLRAVKKILINPPKSFHDWKMKFFFIREEVIPIAMIFQESDKIEKEELPIPKTADWYMRLLATSNMIFGEQVLIAAGMSDKWPARSKEVPVLMFEGEGSSNEKLSSWSNIFSGVLRHLGIDPEEKPKKAPMKKKTNTRKRVAVDTGATSKMAGGSRVTAAVPEKMKSSAAASNSSGSAESRAPESGATPSSLHEEEEEEEEGEEEGVKLVTRKRSREETTIGTTPPAQQAAATQPIGKQGRLRSLYKFSPGWCFILRGPGLKKAKEPELKKTKFVIILPKTITEKEAEKRVEEPAGDVIPEKEVLQETKTAATTIHDKAQGPEVVAHQDTSSTAAGTSAGGSSAASQKGDGKKIPRPRSPIGAEDTLGDIYYKTYTEEHHGEEKHVPVWSLKQKDTFVDFGTCQDWFLGTFTPGEVNRQRARNHKGLYRTYWGVQHRYCQPSDRA
ncbi:hypothetical protein Hanom_Chr00s000648g01653401 [Helianthus anomalus]